MRLLASLRPAVAALFLFVLAGAGLAQGPAAATEQWQSIADDGKGTGTWTFSRKADGQIEVGGVWIYDKTVKCPFTAGRVTVSGSSFTFTVKGNATDSAAPSGYQESHFTLVVKGDTAGGKGSGSYAISFYTTGWPGNLRGKWTATRTEGSGITE